MSEAAKLRELTAAQLVDEQVKGTLVLDTRPAEQFAKLHIRRAIQISLAGRFASWAAILIHPAQKLLLVTEVAKSAQEAHTRLTRVGLEHIIGYSLANERQWRKEGIETASISTHRCATAGGPILHGNPPAQLVDVRSRAEWLTGHLPGAVSIPLLEFDSQARFIDPSKKSLVYCHEGYRATTAASILLSKAAGEVSILIDGVEGWSACGLPLEKAATR